MDQHKGDRLLKIRNSKLTDPWEKLGNLVKSAHCQGKDAVIVMYDHTGWTLAECDCGQLYDHDVGAFHL